MRYFPLFLDIKDKPVLLVGGGEVAARKYSLLAEAGASITVVAPQLGAHASRDGFLCTQAAYIKRLRSSFAHRRVHTTWQEI